MDKRVTFPVTTEEKQRLADFAKRRGWSPTAAARFLCLAGLDLEEFLQQRTALAKEVGATTKPRFDYAKLAAEFTIDSQAGSQHGQRDA
jgi:hypothetical protein